MALQPSQLVCNTQIDYSQVVDDIILPFVISLDLAHSNLTPLPGENQKFCYNIVGVGTDASIFKDLSHFVFGICNIIPASQIQNITVTIDGVEQTIVFGEGGNVELRTLQNPDPTTGCAGLKFDFGLNKIGGEMSVCFELTTVYPVGPIPVCLFGADTPVGGLFICGPACGETQTCEAIGYQKTTVCVPVTVEPFAIAGTATTFCCGDPIVTPNAQTCPGIVNRKCHFTITQTLCVAVPVTFGANTTVGTPNVECITATSEDICTNCEG